MNTPSAATEPRSRSSALRGMHQDKLYDEPTSVTAENGEVILDGPDSVSVRVTPEAAEQTADNLIEGAVKARGQRRIAGLSPHPGLDSRGEGASDEG